jgi:hypothetical protein
VCGVQRIANQHDILKEQLLVFYKQELYPVLIV